MLFHAGLWPSLLLCGVVAGVSSWRPQRLCFFLCVVSKLRSHLFPAPNPASAFHMIRMDSDSDLTLELATDTTEVESDMSLDLQYELRNRHSRPQYIDRWRILRPRCCATGAPDYRWFSKDWQTSLTCHANGPYRERPSVLPFWTYYECLHDMGLRE